MGELYVSASEIEVFDLCARKWAFGYIEGKRPPPNDSAALGSRVHAILEKWLKDGTAPDMLTLEGDIAASGLHLLPAPRTPTLVTEEQFRFTSQRAWYTGFKDFRYRDATGLLHVGDHKTTKSFTWAKTLDEILCHSQALIYAVDEFFKNPNDDRLSLDWIYYRTTGARKAEPRSQIVTKDTVAEMFFEHVDPVAGEITKLHHEVPPGTSALEFAPNFSSCDAFGGCAFLSICNPTPTQRMQATMTQAGLSLTDKLKAMKNGRPPSPIHPPEAFTAPAVLVAPAGVFVPPVPVPTQQFVLPVPTPQGAPQAAAPGIPHLAAVPAYAPPQSVIGPPYREPVAAPFEPPVAAEAPKGRLKPVKEKKPKKVKAAAPEAVPGPYVPTVPAVDESTFPEPVADIDPRYVAIDPRTMEPTLLGFTLYIGCAPVGGKVTNALIYVNAAHDAVRKTRGVAHHRDMEFGKGPGELCKELESLLELCEGTENVPSGDVFLGNTQVEEDTSSVWISRAAKIVRAFR
jgi:hypothetical protein